MSNKNKEIIKEIDYIALIFGFGSALIITRFIGIGGVIPIAFIAFFSYKFIAYLRNKKYQKKNSFIEKREKIQKGEKENNKEKQNTPIEILNLIWKNHKKGILLYVVFAFLIVGSFFVYDYFNQQKQERMACLERINYVSNFYLIEKDSYGYVATPNGHTAKFHKKEDAMKYCLAFLIK